VVEQAGEPEGGGLVHEEGATLCGFRMAQATFGELNSRDGRRALGFCSVEDFHVGSSRPTSRRWTPTTPITTHVLPWCIVEPPFLGRRTP